MMNEKWALITGATSGIGKAFAYAFARRGFHIIGTGTRSEILLSVLEDIRTDTGRETVAFIGDLSLGETQDRLIALGREKQITVLVNNAGFAIHRLFQDTSMDDIIRMSRLHMQCMVRLIHGLLPQMLEARGGTIINVASDAAYLAARTNTIYAGTKAFVRQFSHGLYLDLTSTGVYVQALCPSLTHTDLHQKMGMGRERQVNHGPMRWQEPEDVVKASMKAMDKKKAVCNSSRITTFMAWMACILPEKLYHKMVFALTSS